MQTTERTSQIGSPVASGAWRVRWLALIALLTLTGCATHYPYYSTAPGVYFGDYGSTGEVRYREPYSAAVVDPAVYPYWSLDYFYFSGFHHPYSVFVGYREPLYYPYPGWAFGFSHGHGFGGHGIHHRGFHHFGHGAGYPWVGFGHAAPGFYGSGFFTGFGHSGHHHGHRQPHHDRDRRHLRAIDRRLSELAHVDRGRFDRTALLTDRASQSDRVGRTPRTIGSPPERGITQRRNAAESRAVSGSSTLLRRRVVVRNASPPPDRAAAIRRSTSNARAVSPLRAAAPADARAANASSRRALQRGATSRAQPSTRAFQSRAAQIRRAPRGSTSAAPRRDFDRAAARRADPAPTQRGRQSRPVSAPPTRPSSSRNSRAEKTSRATRKTGSRNSSRRSILSSRQRASGNNGGPDRRRY